MKYQLRNYQLEASNAAVKAFKEGKRNGIVIVPTGGGKSVIIADIASKLGRPLLVLQPSKEILEQNFAKLDSYGVDDKSIFSASLNQKEISRITFATIGSVVNQMEAFKHFRYVLIDEAHLVKPDGGMYKRFITDTKRIVIGLTATPYRLHSYRFGSMLKFITRTRPNIFTKVLYVVQIQDILKQGFLANLQYYDLTKLDMTRVQTNSTGADWSDESLKREYERVDFADNLVATVSRLMHPKSGIPRKGILVFTRFIEEAYALKEALYGEAEVVTGDTPKNERERILNEFKSGIVKVVINVSVLAVGFDYPELDTIVLARPTKSLALYYQVVGRCIRPYPNKVGWIVDLSGTYQQFGKVEDLKITDPENDGKWAVESNGIKLTNVFI